MEPASHSTAVDYGATRKYDAIRLSHRVNLLRRLKVQGPFYDEFAQPPLDAKPSASPPQLPGGVAAAHTPAESLESVLRGVQGAVLAVLGAAVGPDKPLMEAGLDSLGEATGK